MEVNKKQYYKFIGDKNLTFSAYGEYPFTGIWKDKNGNVVAKAVPEVGSLGINRYKYYIFNYL